MDAVDDAIQRQYGTYPYPRRDPTDERSKIYSLYHMLRDLARNSGPVHLARIQRVLDSIGV